MRIEIDHLDVNGSKIGDNGLRYSSLTVDDVSTLKRGCNFKKSRRIFGIHSHRPQLQLRFMLEEAFPNFKSEETQYLPSGAPTSAS